MQSRTKTVHEKSICIQKLLSLFSLALSSFSSPSSESSLSCMSSLLHPSRLCFTDAVDLRFYFFLSPISSTSALPLVQIVDLSFLKNIFQVSVAHTGRRITESNAFMYRAFWRSCCNYSGYGPTMGGARMLKLDDGIAYSFACVNSCRGSACIPWIKVRHTIHTLPLIWFSRSPDLKLRDPAQAAASVFLGETETGATPSASHGV